MTVETFYCDAEHLFDAHCKAYRNRLNTSAWFNGIYTLKAFESSINNVMPQAISFALNGGNIKPVDYPNQPIDMDKDERVIQAENSISEEDMIRAENEALNFFK